MKHIDMKHLDRDTISDAAVSAVRSALPADFMRPKPRRWPFVAISLLVAALFATVFLVRRPLTETISAGTGGLPRYDAEPRHEAKYDPELAPTSTGTELDLVDAEPMPAFGG